jgi:hypothetical protein
MSWLAGDSHNRPGIPVFGAVRGMVAGVAYSQTDRIGNGEVMAVLGDPSSTPPAIAASIRGRVAGRHRSRSHLLLAADPRLGRTP